VNLAQIHVKIVYLGFRGIVSHLSKHPRCENSKGHGFDQLFMMLIKGFEL
jgi:hypothetical protein